MKKILLTLSLLPLVFLLSACFMSRDFIQPQYSRIPVLEEQKISKEDRTVYLSIPYSDFSHSLHRRLVAQGWEVFQVPESLDLNTMSANNIERKANFYVKFFANSGVVSFSDLRSGKTIAYLDMKFLDIRSGGIYSESQFNDGFRLYITTRMKNIHDVGEYNRIRATLIDSFINEFIMELNNNIIIIE